MCTARATKGCNQAVRFCAALGLAAATLGFFVERGDLTMATETWSLDESAPSSGTAHGQRFAIAGVDDLSVTHERMKGGLSEGVDVLTLVNGPLTIRVSPTRGMGILDMHYDGVRLGWDSPVPGPVHPALVPLSEPSGLGWLDGFDELFVRCGLESNGAPEFAENGTLLYPLHGRIANKPARDVRVSIDEENREIRVVGVVEEIRFHFGKLRMTSTLTTRAGDQGFRVRDEVENLSATPVDLQMLYHVNFGSPLLEAGARVVAPLKTVAPRNPRAAEGIVGWDQYVAPQPGFEEQVYFSELLADASNRTMAMLKNASGSRGVRLDFDKSQLPYFTVWKDTAAQADGYVTGLEPGTNFPNPRTFEGKQGRVKTLSAGAKTTFDVALRYLSDAADVAQCEADIAKLQGDAAPQVFDAPRAEWSAP